MALENVRNKRITGKGTLFLPGPEYPRPRPAVVVIQGLGGPKKQREIAYGGFLARKGYIALMTDSFATRGVGGNQTWRALRVSTAMLMADTFSALAWLTGRPQAAPDRIAAVGFSFGGMVSVLTAYRQMHDLFLPGGPSFAAHVSYYGSSIPRMEDPTTTGAPVLMMLGARDGNVSLPRTEQIAADLRAGGSAVEMQVFDAYHQWDGPHLKPHRMGFHLRDCQVRIGADGSIRDEKHGLEINGFWSFLWFLLRNSGPFGYLMQRDTDILSRTNSLLLSFLEKELAPETVHGRRRASSKSETRL